MTMDTINNNINIAPHHKILSFFVLNIYYYHYLVNSDNKGSVTFGVILGSRVVSIDFNNENQKNKQISSTEIMN